LVNTFPYLLQKMYYFHYEENEESTKGEGLVDSKDTESTKDGNLDHDEEPEAPATLNSSLNCPILTSYHSDNWLFYDKRRLSKNINNSPSRQEPHEVGDIEDRTKDLSASSFVSEKNSFTTSIVNNCNNTSDTYFFNMKSEMNSSYETYYKNNMIQEKEICCSSSSSSNSSNSYKSQIQNKTYTLKKDEEDEDKKQNLTITICENDDDDKSCAKSPISLLTCSSCHSERSQAYLNCVVCSTDDSSTVSSLLNEEKKRVQQHLEITELKNPSKSELEKKTVSNNCNKFISTLKIEVNCPVIKYVSSPIGPKGEMKTVELGQSAHRLELNENEEAVTVQDLEDESSHTLKSCNLNQAFGDNKSDPTIVKSFVLCDCDDLVGMGGEDATLFEDAKDIESLLSCMVESIVEEIDKEKADATSTHAVIQNDENKENKDYEFMTSVIDDIFENIDYDCTGKQQPVDRNNQFEQNLCDSSNFSNNSETNLKSESASKPTKLKKGKVILNYL
jgi:hypothetical protein